MNRESASKRKPVTCLEFTHESLILWWIIWSTQLYGNRFLIAFLRGIIVPTYLREEKYIWKLKCSGWWLSLDPLDGLTTLSKWVITVRSPGLYVKAIASLIFNTSSNGRRKYWLWAENWRFHSCSSKAWELACENSRLISGRFSWIRPMCGSRQRENWWLLTDSLTLELRVKIYIYIIL